MLAAGIEASEIRPRRVELGLSQHELAERVGVTGWMVARWEKGDVEPRLPIRRALAEILPPDEVDHLLGRWRGGAA